MTVYRTGRITKAALFLRPSRPWADPGTRAKPAAWPSHGIGRAKSDVHDTGMLWDDGEARAAGAIGIFHWKPAWYAERSSRPGHHPLDLLIR